MNVLIACEFSGAVRDAFRMHGHEAWSCDLENVIPEGKWPNYHLFGDCRNFFLNGPVVKWDLLIAHPPCTYLANSGVRWLYGGRGTTRDPIRWEAMEKATEFFKDLLSAPVEKIAIENPIMHCYAKVRVGREHTQIIQPWQFGHGETKATCLWLKNLPKLTPTNIVQGRNPRVHYASPSPTRGKDRSRTLFGIAEAMAIQWETISSTAT